MRNHRKNAHQSSTENLQQDQLFIDSLPVDKKLGSAGLSRNASPSSSQPSNNDRYGSGQNSNKHYAMKPLPTLDEDPLDLTIV